jgi:WD40 repeat protein
MGTDKVAQSIFMDGDNTIGVVKLWDVETLKLRFSYKIEGGGANSAFSPDGKMMATGGGSRSTAAILWDLGTGRQERFFMGHEKWVYSVAFSSDGKHLLTGGADGEVRLWEVGTGKEIWRQRVGNRDCKVKSLAISANDNLCAVAPDHWGEGRSEVQIHDAKTGALLKQIKLKHKPTCLQFSPNGRILAIGTEGNVIEIMRTQSGKVEDLKNYQTFLHQGKVSGLAFADQGNKLISSGYDGLVKSWDLARMD